MVRACTLLSNRTVKTTTGLECASGLSGLKWKPAPPTMLFSQLSFRMKDEIHPTTVSFSVKSDERTYMTLYSKVLRAKRFVLPFECEVFLFLFELFVLRSCNPFVFCLSLFFSRWDNVVCQQHCLFCACAFVYGYLQCLGCYECEFMCVKIFVALSLVKS